MATLFYDHLIDWQKLSNAVEALQLDSEDKSEVWEEIEHTIHTEVLIIFVKHLPPEKHEEFVERFHAKPYNSEHLEFVKTYAAMLDPQANIEQAVREHLTVVIQGVLEDLHSEE